MKGRFRPRVFFIEEVPGVQLVVSQELPQRAMISVASRLGADDDLRPAAASEFRGIRIGEDFEFLYCIDDWTECEIVDRRVVVVDAVENVAVRRFSRPRRIETAAIT